MPKVYWRHCSKGRVGFPYTHVPKVCWRHCSKVRVGFPYIYVPKVYWGNLRGACPRFTRGTVARCEWASHQPPNWAHDCVVDHLVFLLCLLPCFIIAVPMRRCCKTLVHGFHIFYCHTEWYLIFLLSHDRLCFGLGVQLN